MKHLLALALVVFGAASLAAAPPNIVVILADDLGVNDLGCYGRKDHVTPNLDRLARQGVRFTAAYAACPVCSPTRAALMTGLNPARLRLTTFLPGRPDAPSQKLLHPKIANHLPSGTPTLASALKFHGYVTGCFGKWHLGVKGHQPTDHGFDTYYAGRANTKPTGQEGAKGEFDLTNRAGEFLEKHRGRPVFLYLAHNAPHIPYTARSELVRQNAGAFEPTYAAVIESLDTTVGLLMQKLDELKMTENTVVLFTSDNGGLHVPEGPHARITHNTPYRAGKGYLYEGGLRVPAIVRWPGVVKAGREIATPVITTDWLPTLVGIAGGEVPVCDGIDLGGLLRGQDAKDRPLYWHLPHYTNQGSRPSGAVREGNWKLIEHYEDSSVELFDLAADPSETRNLTGKEPDRVRSLRASLAGWRQRVYAQMNEKNPEFDEVRHRSLYVETDPSRYDPIRATRSEFERMQAWRTGMNDVVRKK
jgi:arylsulfatase A-like enzyme